MASVTNSRVHRKTASLDALLEPVARAVDAAPVPLLVLRLPQFERIAWREGKRAAQRLERKTTIAFLNACVRVLRAGDLTGHDSGSDVYIIAMTAPSRESRVPSSIDCRSALERVAAAMSLIVTMRVETGWTLLRRFDVAAGFEREIERALERGARDRERYEFFAAIGHELRTPLTSIRGYLETLLDDGVDAATARRFLETARREALRMARLLEGMFEFSLLDLSADTLLGCGCPLAQQIDMACEVVRPQAEQRGILLERGRCEAVAVCVEPDACLQLLVNLLDNAIKYGREGGCVTIAGCVRGEDVVVCVDDDGPGIAPAERESIFGLRIRGAQAAGRPGTGIGLAIVKMIAERCGGAIGVAESPLGGARFEVTLPLGDKAVRVS
jgi:signal transduction histidine kinase